MTYEDKHNTPIHIGDTVTHQETTYEVLQKLENGNLLLNPIQGIPQEAPTNEVELVKSFISDVKSLKDIDELQTLLAQREADHKKSKAKKRKVKKGEPELNLN